MGRIALAAALAALLFPAWSAADAPVLTGDVGPNDAFTISLKDASGANVTHLDPGTYTLVVHDHSAMHNFHLFGPGTSATVAATDVDFKGDMTFTITLVDGVYTFACDPHFTIMKGSFTVGTATLPPPPPPTPTPTPRPAAKLAASVGPGARIAVRGAASLGPGKTVLTVKDASAKDNFHLVGPGVNRATGVAFRGTVSWAVTLKAGTYAFRSDAHPKLRGSFTVSA
jgi:plastocyanin